MTISPAKLAQIRNRVRIFIQSEEVAENEDHDYGNFSEEERIGEAVWDLAMRLSLQEETVQRYFDRYLEEEL